MERPQGSNPESDPIPGAIQDVRQSTNEYISSHYRGQKVWVGIIALVYEVVVVWVLLGPLSAYVAVMPFVMVLPIFFLIGFFRSVERKVLNEFMQQFAQAHNYAYQPKGDLAGQDGSIFKFGNYKTVKNMITGDFHGYPLQLFSYSINMPTSRPVGGVSYYFTVLRLQYPKLLPHIYLRSQAFVFGADLDDPVYLTLEGNFYQSFALRVEKGQEIEALQIFTPDFMAALQDNWKRFSLEFVGNHIYVYSYQATTKDILERMHAFGEYLIDKLGPVLDRVTS